jgi:hypothetical protein
MMPTQQRWMLTPSFGMLLLGCLVALIHRRHDFVFDLLEVEAFTLPKSASPSFRFPKSSFLVSQTQTKSLSQTKSQPNSQTQSQTQSQTELRLTSASAAYLDSISYRPPTIEDGLLGVTSKYLDALSSVSNQLYATTNDYAQSQYYATTATEETTTQLQASVPPDATAHVPFSEDQLVNEVVQRVTQEFSSALESFGGETYDNFVDSASTLLADSTPAYIWDLEDAPIKKGSRALRESIQNSVDASSRAANSATTTTTTTPEETLRELTTKLDNTFRSFKENLSSSTHSVTNSVAGSFRTSTAHPNAAMNAAKQQENIVTVKQKFDQGALTPEALSTNAREAVDMASSVANKAASSMSPMEMEKQATVASSAFQRSLSETTINANAAFGGVTSKASNAFGSLVSNTNQGIEKALSTVAKTTTAATSSIAESTNAATSSIFETTNAATSSAIGSVGSVASSAAASVQNSVGAVGASTKAMVVTAQAGTSATTGKVSAVALSASQGFGLPGNAYTGGGDVAGMIEMTVATILSIPRALMDATMMETNPNGMDDLMEGISGSLYNDVLMPLSEPLQNIAAATSTNAATTMASAMANTAVAATPLDQAQAVLKTLQMVLALVVGIPRAALEGLTGLTIGEIQVAISQTDVRALSEQLTGFASAVSTVLVSLLKVVAEAVSVIVTQTGVGSAIASGQEEVVSKLVSFVVEDLLPAILDGLFLILQQFAVMILEGSSYIVTAM